MGANVTIDWTMSENVRKHGYPPDDQEKARRRYWSRRRSLFKKGQRSYVMLQRKS
jgi:hypothetical protein